MKADSDEVISVRLVGLHRPVPWPTAHAQLQAILDAGFAPGEPAWLMVSRLLAEDARDSNPYPDVQPFRGLPPEEVFSDLRTMRAFGAAGEMRVRRDGSSMYCSLITENGPVGSQPEGWRVEEAQLHILSEGVAFLIGDWRDGVWQDGRLPGLKQSRYEGVPEANLQVKYRTYVSGDGLTVIRRFMAIEAARGL